VFEDGPSQTLVLQWAKYYDASDQCSLSRIWGGIHPPADDIRGRLMGIEVGIDAFKFAEEYFRRDTLVDTISGIEYINLESLNLFPNPAKDFIYVQGRLPLGRATIAILDPLGSVIKVESMISNGDGNIFGINCASLKNGMYVIRIETVAGSKSLRFIISR